MHCVGNRDTPGFHCIIITIIITLLDGTAATGQNKTYIREEQIQRETVTERKEKRERETEDVCFGVAGWLSTCVSVSSWLPLPVASPD